MTDKVHGFSHTPDQFLSGGLPMFTATITGANLTTLTGTEEPHAAALDKLIEVISIRAQPVVLGTVKATVLNFAVEHADIFGELDKFNTEATAAFATAFPGATVTITKFDF